MCRGQEGPLTPDKTLELGHHILKAHLYRSMENSPTGMGQFEMEPRDLQALWVSMSTEDASLALGAVRNVSSPNVKVYFLTLLHHSQQLINDCSTFCRFPVCYCSQEPRPATPRTTSTGRR